MRETGCDNWIAHLLAFTFYPPWKLWCLNVYPWLIISFHFKSLFMYFSGVRLRFSFVELNFWTWKQKMGFKEFEIIDFGHLETKKKKNRLVFSTWLILKEKAAKQMQRKKQFNAPNLVEWLLPVSCISCCSNSLQKHRVFSCARAVLVKRFLAVLPTCAFHFSSLQYYICFCYSCFDFSLAIQASTKKLKAHVWFTKLTYYKIS